MPRFIILSVFLLACGGDSEDSAAEEGPATEACEHFAEGPAEAVTAAATEAEAPSVTFAHTRIDVALVDFEGGQGGYVKYEADEAADFLFFLGAADLPFEVVGGAFESSADVSECAEVAVALTAELEVGPVVLKIGPTSATQVQLVVEEAAGDDHDHAHE